MSKKTINKKIRGIVFGVLSFFLSLFLFADSVCILTSLLLTNENIWIDRMNSSNYFEDKTDEIADRLSSLGDAGGLPEGFFENVVDPVQVTLDTRAYMDSYFSGKTALVDGAEFRKKLSSELKSYISETNAKFDEANVEYLADTAARIYSASLDIPLFDRLSGAFAAMKKILPYLIAGLSAASAVIVIILHKCNKWRHRAFKYCYYACAGTCLSLFAAAVYLTVTGGLKNIVLESRAMYGAAVSLGAAATTAVWIFAAFFFVMAFVMFAVYSKLIRRVVSTD